MIETYRGYNSQYANYGVPPNQKYMWTAVDEWTSLEYGDGTIVKFTIDDSKLNPCDIYDYWRIFGDESDPIDIDDEIVDELKKEGYNCYWDEIANGDECICLFDTSVIVKAEIIRTPEDVDEEIQETLKLAGVKLNEQIIDAKSVGDELMNIILKNPTRKELSDNDMNICRGAMGNTGNFYFIKLSQLAHCDLFDTLEKLGINDSPYNTFKYSNKTNTFYYYDPDNDLDFNLIRKELESSPYFKNFAGCKFDTFDEPDYDPELYETLNESVNYDDLSQKVFNNVWTSGDIFDMLEWLLADYITNHSNEKIIQDLIKISNKTNSEELEEYIYTHPKNKICYEIIRNTFFEYFNSEKNKLEQELNKDNKIFRSIQSNHNLETLLETIKKDGIGNCWAKEKNSAQSWNVSGDYKFDYVFESEFDESMVDWEKTMYLRLFDPQEDEIRLKKDINVHLLSVTQYPLPFDMYKSTETQTNLDIVVPIGTKYAY